MKIFLLSIFLFCTGWITQGQTLWIPNGASGIGVNSTNGFIGIGRSQPAYSLDVNGTIQSYSNLRTTTVGTGNGYYADDGAGSTIFSITRQQPNNETRFQSYGFHTFYSGGNTGVERMRIDGNGNVGIGTSTPQTRLDLGELRFDKISSFPAEGSVFEGQWGNYILGDVNNQQRLRFGVSNDSYTRAEIFLDNSNRPDGTISLKTTDGTVNGAKSRLFVAGNGNVGINDDSPSEKLHVDGSVGIGRMGSYSGSGLQIIYADGGSGTSVFKHQRWGGDFYFKRNDANGERTQFYFGGSSSHRMDIYDGNNQVNVSLNSSGNSYFNGGNVGIGTSIPDAKLAVKGQVHAQEVKVDLNVPGPDYVFEKDYKLTSLEEIKNYIDQNKHLPEVPSAKEMEKNGVQLGEMNMLLLKKIEELTLHMIELEKEIQELKRTIKR